MMTFNVVWSSGEVVIVLVELGLVEQRYQAVFEALNNVSSVTAVAVRFGVTRQTVHRWLRRYAVEGLAGLADGSARPLSCPHQMPPVVEARIVELRGLNPGWGPRTILFRLEAEGVSPLPGRSSVYRCLVRHGLIEHRGRHSRQKRCHHDGRDVFAAVDVERREHSGRIDRNCSTVCGKVIADTK